MFKIVADVRKAFPIFEVHCKTVAKQKRLKTEINKKSFEFYRNYAESFFVFAERMELFNKQIHDLYASEITSVFGQINASVAKFYEKSMKDPQGRSIMIQYKKYCDDSINDISKKVVAFVASNDFTAFNEEELEDFAETAKTFGRFFEKELVPLVFSVVQQQFRSIKSINKFSENFVKLVPLLVSAPPFVEEFKKIIELLQVCKNDMKEVKKEIGNEKILKQVKKKRIETPAEEEEEKDDITQNINKLVEYFHVEMEEDDNYKNSEILEMIQDKAEEKINALNDKISKLEKELSKPVGIATAEYRDQFNDTRKLRKQLQDKLEEENAAFNRNVIYSIRGILTEPKMYTTESHIRQVQLMVNQQR